ncbi:MAG: AMP-binding protein, partial [Deltaproteobacteria bacterium]|nr:AMP-binding protein [Deltaproteobacteria bacterium]
MPYDPIPKKPLSGFAVRPNLHDYDEMRRTFSWDAVSRELPWFDAEHINIAHAAIDAHLGTPRERKTAMIWESKKGATEEYTFADLARLSNRFASALTGTLGARPGDRVFFFLDRVPEIYVGIIGALKAGCVIGPLFSAFGPDAVRDRLLDSEARFLVTSPALLRKIESILPDLPALEKIVLVDREGGGTPSGRERGIAWERLMAGGSDRFDVVRTHREDRAVMHYTSGTTGKPKGAVHVHNAVVGHYATAKLVLDLRDDDVYWCTADPGWVTGTSYGMFGPWSNGATQAIYEGGFSARHWYSFIERRKVTVWYTAPTAIRMLMKSGDDLPKQFNLGSLRHTCSVGE